jgi:hypothetical protein
MAGVRRGLQEAGVVEGRNAVIEIRWSGAFDRMPGLATDLVGRSAAVLFAHRR